MLSSVGLCFVLQATRMKGTSLHQFLLPLFLASRCKMSAASNSTLKYLTAGATITDSSNNSAIACLRVTQPVAISNQPGLADAMSFLFPHSAQTGYAVIPPRSNGGLHNAPAPQ